MHDNPQRPTIPVTRLEFVFWPTLTLLIGMVVGFWIGTGF